MGLQQVKDQHWARVVCGRFMCAAYAGKDRKDPLIALYPVPLGFETKYFEDTVTDTEATVYFPRLKTKTCALPPQISSHQIQKHARKNDKR